MDPVVREHYQELLAICYANPASLHNLGLDAEKTLKQSRQAIRQAIGQRSGRLVLTSCGSESINLAIKGYLQANPRLPRRVISSRGEHAATVDTLQYLAGQGYTIDEVPLQKDGRIDLEALEKALEQPAGLLTLIHVSNETGAVNPVADIVRLRNRIQPELAFHLDAVQAFGKISWSFDRLAVDMASGSGHKLAAPKGIGWLSIRTKIRLTPLIHGGGQQKGLRAGTENPPLASALALALTRASGQLQEKQEKVRNLRRLFLDLLDGTGSSHVLGGPEPVPHILALAFPGIRAETLVHALAVHGVYISAGSACSSKQKQRQNRVLQAMGLEPATAQSVVRISFSADNTEDEIRQAVAALEACLSYLIRA